MIRACLTALLALALPGAILARPLPGSMIICTREGLKSIPSNAPEPDRSPACAHSYCETRRKPFGD